MRSFLKTFNEFFNRLDKTQLLGVVFLLVGLLGYLDYATGFEVSTSFLYLIPIFIATWYLTLRTGYFITFLSIITWTIANFLAGETFSNQIIRYWNVSVRMATFYIFAWLLNELKSAFQLERELSRQDPLTGVKNRREFYAQAALELSHTTRMNQPFSLAYFDLDSFKRVNDERGHNAGDELLQRFTRIVSDVIRKTDVLARMGGDEFALLLPNTAEEGAHRVAWKIEEAVASEMFGMDSPVTLSMGVVTFKSAPKTVEEMIHKADLLMYQAKSTGKGKTNYLIVG